MKGRRGAKPSAEKYERARREDVHPPKREPFKADNLAVGGAVAGLGWSVASVVLRMPELALAAGSAAVGALGVAQALKARSEARRKKRKTN